MTRLTRLGEGTQPKRADGTGTAGARRGKPAGATLLNTMGGYHHAQNL